MIVPRKCDWCNTSYEADSRYLRRGQGRYCTHDCAAKARGKAMTKPKHPNVSCAVCSLQFYVKPSRIRQRASGLFYCSQDHARRGQEQGQFKTGPPQDPTRPYSSARPKKGSLCPGGCGRVYTGRRGLCRKCYNTQIVAQWLAGDNAVTLNGGKSKETKAFVKQYLIATRGDRCEVCGFDEKAPDGRSIIQMDHIDGNCFNNSPDNLQLLCPNHHAMTPTYGALNTGSGRAHRRKQA